MKKVLIVEGKNDCAKIKKLFPNLPILITNGSEVSDSFLELLKKLSDDHEVVLFMDPDFSGEYIRKKICSVVPNASHIFIEKKNAISKNKKKVGVEHVRPELIQEALKQVNSADYHPNVTLIDLYDLGLIGEKNSKTKREKVCNVLKIGYVNGKQLVNRLNLFNITLDRIKEIL